MEVRSSSQEQVESKPGAAGTAACSLQGAVARCSSQVQQQLCAAFEEVVKCEVVIAVCHLPLLFWHF